MGGHKEMKKKIVVGISALIICVVAVFLVANPLTKNKSVDTATNASSVKKNKDVVFEGKTDSYNSLGELQDKSPIIVKGIKNKEKKTEIFRSSIDNSVVDGYTESDFKITEVHKNLENDVNIKSGNNISISEGAFYDQETDTTYRTNGYKNMIDGKEYLLFLIPTEDGLYAPRSVTYGKVPLDTDDPEVYLDSEEQSKSEVKADKDQIKELNDIFEDARTEYNNE